MAPSTVSAPGTPPEAPPRTWWQRRLLDPFLALLKAGLSPASLALTVGLGAVIGAAPTFGLTTILCTIVALRLRLNLAAMQLVCHLMSPVQLLLLLPLLRYGAALLGHGEEVATLTLKQIEHMFRHEPSHLFTLIWRAELGAVLLWTIAAVPLVAGLYFVLKPIFARVLRRQQAAATEPTESGVKTTIAEQNMLVLPLGKYYDMGKFCEIVELGRSAEIKKLDAVIIDAHELQGINVMGLEMLTLRDEMSGKYKHSVVFVGLTPEVRDVLEILDKDQQFGKILSFSSVDEAIAFVKAS